MMKNDLILFPTNMTEPEPGDKEQFATGAMRDKADEKPRPELVSPFAIERLAYWLRDGAPWAR
jgi:hypothetical protein